MPTPDTANYEFREPLDTAHVALSDLQNQWLNLSDSTQGDLAVLLASFRSRLYQAEGNLARGMALSGLLFALESAAALPDSTAKALQAAHRPRRRTSPSLSSEQAHDIKQQIDLLIGEDNELAPTAAEPDSAEEFPPDVSPRVIIELNSRWADLSLQSQDQVFLWLVDYDDRLRDAENDYQRLLASYQFLRRVKSNPPLYALLGKAFVVRNTGGAIFNPGVQAMSHEDAARIRDLIGSSPLRAVAKTPFWRDVHASMISPRPPALTVQELAEPTVIDYHTDVRFHRQVSTFEHDIPLRVRLALNKSASSVVDETVAIEFITPDPQQVLVVCNAEGFIVDDQDTKDSTRTILVYPGQDSQWAVFLLTPDLEAGPGTRRISLDFHHRGRPVGTASFEVEVRDRPPVDKSAIEPTPLITDQAEDGSILERVAGRFTLASPDASRPDFVLRVLLSADRRRLTYILSSPDGKLGLGFRGMGSVKLEMDPRTFMEKTLLRLSQMARASREKLDDEQIAIHQETLREIGWELYEQLFTDKLKQAYRDLYQLRKTEGNLSLLIVSDEPWIPWEMVLPHENLPEDDFLCAQFHLTRWLEGRGLPEDISLRQAQVVTPKSNLASVKLEQDYFTYEVPRLRSEITLGPSWLDTAMQVKLALSQGDSQWFHFACHGNFDATRPDESALVLQDGPLTPSQIAGPRRQGVAISRPLVFLNACHTAEAGFSLTRMGGWAERFVRAGASAFIGSLWEVNDDLAAQFAIAFYNKLLAGHTLGEAFHAARLHIRTRDDANPTWLAYTLYADPNGKIQSR